MHTAYLGIGSNFGNRTQNIEAAFNLIRDKGIVILNCSSIIETIPEGGPTGQKKYLNAVLKIKTKFTPLTLLMHLKNIENRLGRVKTIIDGPRPIDLDILLYDNLCMNTPRLIIPHPRMWHRSFVIKPLQEIEPEFTEDFINARHSIHQRT